MEKCSGTKPTRRGVWVEDMTISIVRNCTGIRCEVKEWLFKSVEVGSMCELEVSSQRVGWIDGGFREAWVDDFTSGPKPESTANHNTSTPNA